MKENGRKTVRLPRNLVDALSEEAKSYGLTVEDYLLQLLAKDSNTGARAKTLLQVAREQLAEAHRLLDSGDAGSAAERAWSATVLALKAHAAMCSGLRLIGYNDLWNYTAALTETLGEVVANAWAHANTLHKCLGENMCDRTHVAEGLRHVEVMVDTLSKQACREQH